MGLADAILGNPQNAPQALEVRRGIVTQIEPLLVRVGHATTAQPCQALDSYSASIGDAVSVMVLDGDRLVLGKARATGQHLYNAQHGSSGTTSGATASTIASIPLAASGTPGYVMVVGHAFVTFTTAGDQFEIYIDDNASVGPSDRINTTTNRLEGNFHPVGFFATDGVTPHTYTLKVQRASGAGTASYFGSDPRYGMLHTVFFPGG